MAARLVRTLDKRSNRNLVVLLSLQLMRRVHPRNRSARPVAGSQLIQTGQTARDCLSEGGEGKRLRAALWAGLLLVARLLAPGRCSNRVQWHGAAERGSRPGCNLLRSSGRAGSRPLPRRDACDADRRLLLRAADVRRRSLLSYFRSGPLLGHCLRSRRFLSPTPESCGDQ